MLCANDLPSARPRPQAQRQADLGTGKADTVYCLHRGSRSWRHWGRCCTAIAGKAEGHMGKAARHAGRAARPSDRSARRLDYGQTAGVQDEAGEGGREEEGNCPWALCMPTCLY